MYLGITLNRLGDFPSAKSSLQKAIELEPADCTIYLNYALILFNNGYNSDAKEQFLNSEKVFGTLDDEDKEPEMLDQREVLAERLGLAIDDW